MPIGVIENVLPVIEAIKSKLEHTQEMSSETQGII